MSVNVKMKILRIEMIILLSERRRKIIISSGDWTRGKVFIFCESDQRREGEGTITWWKLSCSTVKDDTNASRDCDAFQPSLHPCGTLLLRLVAVKYSHMLCTETEDPLERDWRSIANDFGLSKGGENVSKFVYRAKRNRNKFNDLSPFLRSCVLLVSTLKICCATLNATQELACWVHGLTMTFSSGWRSIVKSQFVIFLSKKFPRTRTRYISSMMKTVEIQVSDIYDRECEEWGKV